MYVCVLYSHKHGTGEVYEVVHLLTAGEQPVPKVYDIFKHANTIKFMSHIYYAYTHILITGEKEFL